MTFSIVRRHKSDFSTKSQQGKKIFKKLTCSGVILAEGVYSSNLLTKSMASGEVRARKTFCQGCALIWGNLNSV